MKILKYSIVSIAAIIILVMVVATFIESSKGATFVADTIYSATWFVAFWGFLACLSIAYIIKHKLFRRVPVFMLHVSFVIILCGAFTSWLTSKNGTLHLRKGETTTSFLLSDNSKVEMGFPVQLKDFEITYYPGTDAPQDYSSVVTVAGEDIHISMNNIGQCHGYRFTQAGYDSDMEGSTFGVLYDPYGITVTYVGYLLLLLSIIITLISKHTNMRNYYKKSLSTVAKKGIMAIGLLLLPLCGHASDQQVPTVDKHLADEFGKVCVLYNSRICPINTVATAFVTKLTGKATWNGYSANEIFMGWAFNAVQWEHVKMIRVKDKEARRILGIDDEWASLSDFWDQYNDYKLQRPMDDAIKQGDMAMEKHLRDADEKFNIIRMFYGGEMLHVFPCVDAKGKMTWTAPGQALPSGKMSDKEMFFVRKAMDYLAESVIFNDQQRTSLLIQKIVSYQRVKAHEVMPSTMAIQAELIHNKLMSYRWSIMLFLTLALVVVIASTLQLSEKMRKKVNLLSYTLHGLMLVYTTAFLALRWYISGHLPLSNGYETMLFMAWAILLLTLFLQRKFNMIHSFGPLLSAFALLVAMINGGNPQITQLMPVLQSPLLSVHVMVIMFAYSLFAIMALTSIQGLIAYRKHDEERTVSLAAFSKFLLYPAEFLLTVGIFIGAVWANISWGRYWGWDSKEVWALITMMVYAAPLHSTLRWMQKPLHTHIYMLLAFLVVLMTYFGVNYFLPGLHSYANV